MVFSSLIFLLFLFVCLAVQHFCPNTKARNSVLLVFSLIFYLWGGVRSLVLLIIVTLADWYAALMIADQTSRTKRKQWLGGTVAVNVILFAVLRFWELFPWAGESTSAARYAIPMGFAFYTIQLISYLVDVYRGTVPPQQKFTDILLYSALFSQSAGGPVIRYSEIRRDLKKRKTGSAAMSRGIMRFSCGLAKKVLLADSCGVVVTAYLGEDINALASAPVLAVWLGSIFFMLQLFLELSGYADMAVGLGLMCGFRFPENFNYPYVSSTLSGFWSRWNITVVGFFRDYVYAPLGSGRHGRIIQILNLVITWLLFGLWCGGSANLMLWALYCLALLLLEGLFRKKLAGLPHAAGHIWVLVTMLLGFVLYRYSDLGMLAAALKGLIGLNGAGFATAETLLILVRHLLLLILSVLACTPLTRMTGIYMKEKAKEDRTWLRLRAVTDAVCPAVLLLLSILGMVGNQLPAFAFFQL